MTKVLANLFASIITLLAAILLLTLMFYAFAALTGLFIHVVIQYAQ